MVVLHDDVPLLEQAMPETKAWVIQRDRSVNEWVSNTEKNWQTEIDAFLETLPRILGKRISASDDVLSAVGAGVRVRYRRNAETRTIRVIAIREDETESRNVDRTRIMFPISVFGCGSVVVLVIIILVSSLFFQGRPGIPNGTAVFSETQRSHVSTPVTYDHSPPAGGNHPPRWATCGIYQTPLPNGEAVHSLEHGAVWVTYRPDIAAAELRSLRELVASHYIGAQRYLLLSPYPGQTDTVAVTAWGAQLRASDATDPRLAQFMAHFGAGYQALEPNAYCLTGGDGAPIA